MADDIDINELMNRVKDLPDRELSEQTYLTMQLMRSDVTRTRWAVFGNGRMGLVGEMRLVKLALGVAWATLGTLLTLSAGAWLTGHITIGIVP